MDAYMMFLVSIYDENNEVYTALGLTIEDGQAIIGELCSKMQIEWMEDSEELFVYTRTLEDEKLLVVCSFCDHETKFTMPAEFAGAACLIANVENEYDKAGMTLNPYEAFVLYRKIA